MQKFLRYCAVSAGIISVAHLLMISVVLVVSSNHNQTSIASRTIDTLMSPGFLLAERIVKGHSLSAYLVGIVLSIVFYVIIAIVIAGLHTLFHPSLRRTSRVK